MVFMSERRRSITIRRVELNEWEQEGMQVRGDRCPVDDALHGATVVVVVFHYPSS